MAGDALDGGRCASGSPNVSASMARTTWCSRRAAAVGPSRNALCSATPVAMSGCASLQQNRARPGEQHQALGIDAAGQRDGGHPTLRASCRPPAAARPRPWPVAHVAEVFDADLARPESGRDQIAHRREEADAVADISGRALARPGDVVEHLAALGVGAVEERLVEAPRGTRCRATPGRRASPSAARAARRRCSR